MSCFGHDIGHCESTQTGEESRVRALSHDLRGNLSDGEQQQQECQPDSPEPGIHLPPITWGLQNKYSADGMLLASASERYVARDYSRGHGESLALVGNSPT